MVSAVAAVVMNLGLVAQLGVKAVLLETFPMPPTQLVAVVVRSSWLDAADVYGRARCPSIHVVPVPEVSEAHCCAYWSADADV